MQRLVTLAIILGLLGLTAADCSAQTVTIAKTNFKAGVAGGMPDTMQPEGKIFIGQTNST